MKQIDYLKLVATGRSSSFYAKPSEQDEALRNFILVVGVCALALTFGLAVLISYLGTRLELDDVSYAMLASFGPFVSLLLASFFLSGARDAILPLIYILCFIVFIIIMFVIAGLPEGHWPMYMPSLANVVLVGVAALRNSMAIGQSPRGPTN